MKIKSSVAMILTLGLLGASPLYAQDEDTMIVIDDETTIDEVTNVLELPEDASAEAVENSAFGVDTANRAREDGRAFGEQQAAEARSRGQEARETAGESARDNARDAADRGSDARDAGDDARDGAGAGRGGR